MRVHESPTFECTSYRNSLTSNAEDTYSTPIFSDVLPFDADAGISATWSSQIPFWTGPLSNVADRLAVDEQPRHLVGDHRVDTAGQPHPVVVPVHGDGERAAAAGAERPAVVADPGARHHLRQPHPHLRHPSRNRTATRAAPPPPARRHRRTASTEAPGSAGFGSRIPKPRNRFTTSCADSRGSNVLTPRASGNSR